MKKLLAIAAAFMLVGAGCASAQPQPAPQPTPAVTAPAVTPPAAVAPPKGKPTPIAVPNPGGISPANSEDRVVAFTSMGVFDPASVAVHVGRTVTWKNLSSQDMWPASVSPTQCPGFDAGGPVHPGASYTFTFTKAATCNYINHLRNGASGLVTVTPAR